MLLFADKIWNCLTLHFHNSGNKMEQGVHVYVWIHRCETSMSASELQNTSISFHPLRRWRWCRLLVPVLVIKTHLLSGLGLSRALFRMQSLQTHKHIKSAPSSLITAVYVNVACTFAIPPMGNPQRAGSTSINSWPQCHHTVSITHRRSECTACIIRMFLINYTVINYGLE